MLDETRTVSVKKEKLVPLGLRVPPDLAQWLREQAEVNRRSVAGQATWAMEQVMKQQAQQPAGAAQ